MSPVGSVLRAAIRAYQLVVSPLLPPSCRFTPSCSAYAAEAILRFGAAQGSWLAAKRLCRCHPWGGEGCDPVPAPLESPAARTTAAPARHPDSVAWSQDRHPPHAHDAGGNGRRCAH